LVADAIEQLGGHLLVTVAVSRVQMLEEILFPLREG
jgi:hypothetical protein